MHVKYHPRIRSFSPFPFRRTEDGVWHPAAVTWQKRETVGEWEGAWVVDRGVRAAPVRHHDVTNQGNGSAMGEEVAGRDGGLA